MTVFQVSANALKRRDILGIAGALQASPAQNGLNALTKFKETEAIAVLFV